MPGEIGEEGAGGGKLRFADEEGEAADIGGAGEVGIGRGSGAQQRCGEGEDLVEALDGAQGEGEGRGLGREVLGAAGVDGDAIKFKSTDDFAKKYRFAIF